MGYYLCSKIVPEMIKIVSRGNMKMSLYEKSNKFIIKATQAMSATQRRQQPLPSPSRQVAWVAMATPHRTLQAKRYRCWRARGATPAE